jgi:hypothetical protein
MCNSKTSTTFVNSMLLGVVERFCVHGRAKRGV